MKTHWENQDKDSKVKMDFQTNPTFITEIIGRNFDPNLTEPTLSFSTIEAL